MTVSAEPSIAKQPKSFQVEIVENIECYYVATSTVQHEILDLGEASHLLLKQVEDLKLTDFRHLSSAFENIFGEKPTDTEELIEYYESSTAGISVNVVNEDEILLSVRFEFDFEDGSLNFSRPEIDVIDSYREQLSDALGKLNKM